MEPSTIARYTSFGEAVYYEGSREVVEVDDRTNRVGAAAARAGVLSATDDVASPLPAFIIREEDVPCPAGPCKDNRRRGVLAPRRLAFG